MKRAVIAAILGALMGSGTVAFGAPISMSIAPAQPKLGDTVQFQCSGTSDWRGPLTSAKISITDARGDKLVNRGDMQISGTVATYGYSIPTDETSGTWSFNCVLRERGNRGKEMAAFTVAGGEEPPTANRPPIAADDSATTGSDAVVTIDVAANDTDADGNLEPDTVTLLSGASSGSAVPAGGGSITYTPEFGFSGTDSFGYEICDSGGLCDNATVSVTVEATQPPADEPPIVWLPGTNNQHDNITEYNGPATCLQCHKSMATEMLGTVHMKWAGPTPDLTNNSGEELGKGNKGINTFCTYAPSSKGACYSCHVRADGNAPDAPMAEDVDCLMCHSDSYQRKFVADPNNTETVTNIDNQEKTYVFGKVDEQGNYTTVPDYSKMTINVVDAARTVHLPTNTSCLRCHAKAGGGDWTKRGDMGLNSANATADQDVHLAKSGVGGAGLSCVDCHSANNHEISGRGIDLRQTEAGTPTCSACHTESPHESSTLNRHAGGQISCQVCHIRTFAKGGATEMSRDWLQPTWNQAFCSGQGGFVGHEVKKSNVKPEYVWFDGTSYVYNVGETIQPDGRGVLPMAKAHGSSFDGKSKIVPIKRHSTNIPWDDNGKIIPPSIMWMFMTGDFDQAVTKGLEAQALDGDTEYTGSYEMVQADAEMLITHGVEPAGNAPLCIECHDGTGSTPDTYGMVPFGKLGYHTFQDRVLSCDRCHGKEDNLSFEALHGEHRGQGVSCQECHLPNSNG